MPEDTLSAIEWTALICLLEPAVEGYQGRSTPEALFPASVANRKIFEAAVDLENRRSARSDPISYEDVIQDHDGQLIFWGWILIAYYAERARQVLASQASGFPGPSALTAAEYALLGALLCYLAEDVWLFFQGAGASEYFALTVSDEARTLAAAAVRHAAAAGQHARLRAVAVAEHWIPVEPCEMLRWLAFRCAEVTAKSAPA